MKKVDEFPYVEVAIRKAREIEEEMVLLYGKKCLKCGVRDCRKHD